MYNFIDMKSNGILTAIKLLGSAIKIWWEDWVNGVVVSLAMILSSMTIILVGPAVLGVCSVCADLADGTRTGIMGWWEGFKRYFWQGLTWGLLNLALLLVFVISLLFYMQIEAVWSTLLVGFLITIAVFWFFMQFYTPGFLMEQEDKSLWLAWKNSFLTILSVPGMTLVLGLFSFLVGLLSVGLLLPLILGTGPLLGLLSVLSVRNRFEICHEDEDNQ